MERDTSKDIVIRGEANEAGEAGERLEVRIDPMGAQLMSVALGGREYLWQGDER